MKTSFILKIGEDQYLKAKNGGGTKYPDLALEFPTTQSARTYAEAFDGGSAWEVWAYQVNVCLVPGV